MLEINIIRFQHDSFSNNVYPKNIIRQESKTINPNIYDGISFNAHPCGYIYYILIKLDDITEIRFMCDSMLSDVSIRTEIKNILKDSHKLFTFENWIKLVEFLK